MTPKKSPAKKPAAIPSTQRQLEPADVKVFFDVRDASYWFRVTGRYVQLSKSDLHMHLRVKGIRDDVKIEGLSELDWVCYNAQVTSQVNYAGPLAGHRVGVYTNGSGQRFLVTTEPSLDWDYKPTKKAPEPKWFSAFIQELLPRGQWTYVCFWLAIALRNLLRGTHQPGQALFLVGPAKCGKSLLQTIITELLGGRSCDPFRYLAGLTQFNKDLAEAEHWCIEDPKSTTDMRTRREFGDTIKSATVNRLFSIHAKSKDATLTLPILRRISVSVNNELENLSRCPPLDPSLADKVFLCECQPVVEALEQFRTVDGTKSLLPETRDLGEMNQDAIRRKIAEEIPQIRAWLLTNFCTVPPELRDDRFGVEAYHHPELLAELSSLEPWERLLQLIDAVLFTLAPGEVQSTNSWEGKAFDLEQHLRDSKFAFETEKILRTGGLCGSYLGRLARAHPKRISKRTAHGNVAVWEIKPPWENKTDGVQQ